MPAPFLFIRNTHLRSLIKTCIKIFKILDSQYFIFLSFNGLGSKNKSQFRISKPNKKIFGLSTIFNIIKLKPSKPIIFNGKSFN